MDNAVPSPILQSIRRVVVDQCVRQLSDHDLLQRFAGQRDEPAFHALLLRHGPMVLEVCRGVLRNEADTEDAFQATFLILARKSASIRKTASVGSWLHGVAYRTALKARAQLATRQKNEARAPARQGSETDDFTWREVRQVLHEELSGLAERYRAPLVACYLEGKTQDEAAAQLGLAKTTLKERLERARSILRARLVRRGLGPAAVLIASAWPSATASASLPATLMSSTIKAAGLFAAGQAATTGVISANVAALTEGVLKTMFLTKLKVMMAVMLVVGMVGAGTTSLLSYTQAGKKAAAVARSQPADDPKQDEKLRLKVKENGPNEDAKRKRDDWEPQVKKEQADREELSKKLIGIADDAKRPEAERWQAVMALARLGTRDGLEYLVEHIALRLQPPNPRASEDLGEDMVCFYALMSLPNGWEGDGRNWNVAQVVLRALAKPRTEEELWRYALVLELAVGVTRLSDGKYSSSPRAVALLDAEIASESAVVLVSNLKAVRKRLTEQGR
jgi:RNA polymerase sigma factor (sigma-70 family)